MPSGSKSLPCHVILLDDQVQEFQLPRKAYGDDLYNTVYKHLQLLETDYFGLEFKIDQKDIWLDKDKPVLYQLKRDTDLSFKFKVKFYSSDANLLEDEFTRYLFALQIKQDLATGRLICNPNTTALLAAYIAQSELGDYSAEEMLDHTYLKCISFVPDQTDELEQCVMQYHRSMGGLSPSEADFKLLDTARKTDYYGILLRPAQDHEGVSLQLAVTELGICVYQHRQKINTFSWAKIRKLSFKRKRFLIKLHPASDQSYYKNIVEFFFDSRNESKSFWKNCIEHHAFFRCRAIATAKKQKRAVLTRGSSFRYTGRTQKQLLDHVKDNYVKGTRSFERSLSARHTLNVTASRSFNPSRSTTLNSKSDFNPEASLSSGSHMIGGSQSQHSGFQTPNSFLTPTQSPPREPNLSIHNSPSKMDRKYSAPALPHVEAGVSAPEAYLTRAPDYTNIPEKVEEPEARLSRTDSTSNIPQEVTEDEHAEPSRLQNNHLQVEDSAMIRVHSEAETNILNKYPRIPNAETSPAPPAGLSNGSPVKTNTVFHIGGTTDVVTNGNTTPEHTIDKSRSIKRASVDRSYFIAKELLMTERTYNKDLSILMIHFRESLKDHKTEPAIFNSLQPLFKSESEFLSALEKRLAGDSNKVSADLLANDVAETLDDHLQHLNMYEDYLMNLDKTLLELMDLCENDEGFCNMLSSFEQEKNCYLPVFSIILKPAHRLVYYEILLSKLVKYYESLTLTVDYSLLQTCLQRITHIFSTLRSTIAELENTEKLIELQQDISGLNHLVKNGRYFVREGCLQKLSRRGYQQRLFLLFSDVLLYTSRVTGNSHLQFKVHGFLPLAGMTLEEGDVNIGVSNGFTIYGANRCLIVAASTPEERDKWLEDLNFAISISNSDQIELQEIPLPEITPPTNGVAGEDDTELPTTPDKNPAQPTQHRANTTMHVCWHRNTSVGIKDIQEAIRQQLSGYLLRKFKNSNGWQKLWVVFTNFCLFFYKTYQDDHPLASLPLLGYAVCKPSASDGINKDYVFKLQFKNHVYFFRADSEYTYERWMEVINSATHSARRTRLFSRIDSMT